MEQQSQTLKKPNAALVMVSRSVKLTGIERKLFNSVLMSSISQLVEYRAKNGSDPDNKHLYSASADELLDPIEVGKSNLKSILRKCMLSLRRAEVDWEAPDAKSGVIWKNVSVLSQASIEILNGRLYAKWALPPHLNEAISDTKAFPFTRLDLAQISLLSSYTAVALYELCARYRNNFLRGGTGQCLTSSSDPNWWVDALTNNLPKVDKKTGNVVRREWRKVKSESVLKAIREINELTDLEVQLIETKTGKAISLVQFSVRQKRQPTREIDSDHFDLIRLAARLGLPQNKVESALAKCTRTEVSLALAKFEARLNQKDEPSIERPGAYFDSILKNSQPIELVENILEKTGSSPRDQSKVQSYEKSQRATIKEKFMVLSDQQKNEYGRRALEQLKARGMATERITTNAEGGVWSGVLLSQMLDVYEDDGRVLENNLSEG
jgi:hypothetical protein